MVATVDTDTKYAMTVNIRIIFICEKNKNNDHGKKTTRQYKIRV